MRKHVIWIFALSCLLTLVGCQKSIVASDLYSFSEPTVQITGTFYSQGQNLAFEIGSEQYDPDVSSAVSVIIKWFYDLKLTACDALEVVDGSECYEFYADGKYAFTYEDRGTSAYILANGDYYQVINPSDPPIYAGLLLPENAVSDELSISIDKDSDDVDLSNDSDHIDKNSMRDDAELSDSPKQKKTDVCIDTEYYSIAVPDSWYKECFYEVIDGESYNYTLCFYDKSSHDAGYGGLLFSIRLLTEFEDYAVYPDYEVLGSLEVYRIGSYNCIVTYPTDVQFSERTADNYAQMSAEIDEILNTLSFKDECVFSTEPIPIDNSMVASASLSADFYAELCAYTLSACVNYTEWWKDPTLSYTNPTHYYLGTITAENYDEKMEKAKQLVDTVYKAGYWEIRYNGYGKIYIGLYITPEDELYFCYK